MANRINIYFEGEDLQKAIEEYSKKRGISFSKALVELAAAGLNFYDRFNNLNVDLIQEKIKTSDRVWSLLEIRGIELNRRKREEREKRIKEEKENPWKG